MLAGKILSDARIPRAGAPRGRRPLRELLPCLDWTHVSRPARLRAAHAYLGLLYWLPADRARLRITAEVGTGSGNGMENVVSGGRTTPVLARRLTKRPHTPVQLGARRQNALTGAVVTERVPINPTMLKPTWIQCRRRGKSTSSGTCVMTRRGCARAGAPARRAARQQPLVVHSLLASSRW